MRLLVLRSNLTLVMMLAALPTMAAPATVAPDTLQEALIQVYSTSPTLQAARDSWREVQELYPQARAGWLPTLSAEGSIYKSNIDNSNFSGGNGATTREASLNLDQPIWRGGRTMAEIHQANAQIKGGAARLAQAEQGVFMDTIVIYTNLIRDRAIARWRHENQNLLAQEFNAAYERRKIGELTKTDVEQARTRLSRAQAEAFTADSTLNATEAAFEELIGTPAPKNLKTPDIKTSLPATLDAMTKMADAQNPNLNAAIYDHQAAEHKIDVASSELWPQISAFASTNRQYDPQPGIVDKTTSETIGVRARISLYEGGATRSRIREAKYATSRQDNNVTSTRRQIKQDVIANYAAFQAAGEERRSRALQVASAEKARIGVREEARIGQRTMLDVLDAGQDVIDAQVALTQATRNETVTRAQLAATLGLLRAEPLGIIPADSPVPTKKETKPPARAVAHQAIKDAEKPIVTAAAKPLMMPPQIAQRPKGRAQPILEGPKAIAKTTSKPVPTQLVAVRVVPVTREVLAAELFTPTGAKPAPQKTAFTKTKTPPAKVATSTPTTPWKYPRGRAKPVL